MKYDHYYIFEAPIEFEPTRQFLDWLSAHPTGNILFSITSRGGLVTTARLLLKALNDNKDRITIHVLGGVYSAAFLITYEYEGAKALTRNESKGMFHYGIQMLSTDERGQVVYKEDRVCLRNLKLAREESQTFASQFMNKAELNSFRKGDDVYFDFKRMSEIFPTATVI